MKKLISKIFAASILAMSVSTLLFAATGGTNIRDVAGLGANVANALKVNLNAASGVPVLNSAGKLTKDTTGNAATASAVPVTGVSGLGTGVQAALAVAKNTAGGPVVSDSNNQIAGSAVAGLIPVASGVTAVPNDTFVAGSGVINVVHHAAGAVYTGAHTLVAADWNTTSFMEYNAASDATISVDTYANVPTVAGDCACIKQTSTGCAVISGVSSAVTIDAESSKKTTNGNKAVVCVCTSGTQNTHTAIGNRK